MAKRSFSRRLRDVLVLQVNTPTQDANGQPIESWGDVLTFRADIVPRQSREFLWGRNVSAETTVMIVTRDLNCEVSPLHRIKGQDSCKVYNVTGVIEPDHKGLERLIYATEEVV